MTIECLNCNAAIEQVPGKRSRLYCNDKCKSKYFQELKACKANNEMVSISKSEYERLLNIEIEYKSLALSCIINPMDVESFNYANSVGKGNSKGKQIKGTDEAVNNAQADLDTNDYSTNRDKLIDSLPKLNKIPPDGLSKSQLMVWRKNNR